MALANTLQTNDIRENIKQYLNPIFNNRLVFKEYDEKDECKVYVSINNVYVDNTNSKSTLNGTNKYAVYQIYGTLSILYISGCDLKVGWLSNCILSYTDKHPEILKNINFTNERESAFNECSVDFEMIYEANFLNEARTNSNDKIISIGEIN